MIQAIRDLADAFVPSGKLIEMVDIGLVSVSDYHYHCTLSFMKPWRCLLLSAFLTDLIVICGYGCMFFVALGGKHPPLPLQG